MQMELEAEAEAQASGWGWAWAELLPGPGLRLELELGLMLELTLGLEDRARQYVPRPMSVLFGYSSVGRAPPHEALQPRTTWVRTPRAPFVKLGRNAGSDAYCLNIRRLAIRDCAPAANTL